MELSDNELMLIEQLTYLGSDVCKEAGLESFVIDEGMKYKSIGEILAVFTEDRLKELEAKTYALGLGGATGVEWASIIRYLKNSEMSNMILSDTMSNSEGTTLALCFTEKNDNSNAVVAFKGTSGGNEWIDNVEGLNKTDTKCQKEALDYIEGLEYKNITVVGHSKGGNKAMYVAVTSDKVTRCISMDGQGFSQEFIDKYWAEINEKGPIISNYSVSTDYVHALLFPIPNSNQIYCQGYDGGEGIHDPAQHHSANSFFVTDNKGNLVLSDTDGKFQVYTINVEEDVSVKMLHEFTTFVINNAVSDDKKAIISYLSGLMPLIFTDKPNKDDIIEYIISDTDTLADVLAYLVKYMDVYDLGAEDIDALLEMLGLNKLNELVNLTEIDLPYGVSLDINLNLANILNTIKINLTDNDDDWFLTNIVLSIISKFVQKKYDVDISTIWKKIDSKVKHIDASNGKADASVRKGEIRDFSNYVYSSLMNSVNKIERTSLSVSSWNRYAGEEWYTSLLVSIAVKGINSYFSRLSETNSTCKGRINTLFDKVNSIDSYRSNLMSRECQNINVVINKIISVIN